MGIQVNEREYIIEFRKNNMDFSNSLNAINEIQHLTNHIYA